MSRPSSAIERYLIPVVTIGLALLITVVLLKTGGPRGAVAFGYLFAVLISAWMGGYGPGVLACIGSLSLSPYLMTPGFTLDRLDVTRLVLVICVSLLVSYIAEQRRKVEASLLSANAELDKRVGDRTRELDAAVAALQEREERQRRAVEAGKVGLWEWDIANNQVTWSEKIYELHGVPQGQFGGTVEEFTALVHPHDAGHVGEKLREALAGRAPYEVEFRPLRTDEQHRWLSTTGSVTFDADGKAVSMRGAVVDSTARRDAEEALRRNNEELEQFAYIASHDLQEPLRQIAIYGQLLQRRYGDQLDEEGRRFLTQSVEGAQRMRALVDDLLTYSSTTRGAQPSPQPVDLNEVLLTIRETLSPRITETGAVIEIPAMPIVSGHPSLLLQVWQNLLVNALTYRSDGVPQVRVSARRMSGEWAFTVSDNGIGIAKEHHEQIFQIFQRLHGRDVYAGTGLGLAICKKIVERSGGRIWVESAPGEGATFHFTLADA